MTRAGHSIEHEEMSVKMLKRLFQENDIREKLKKFGHDLSDQDVIFIEECISGPEVVGKMEKHKIYLDQDTNLKVYEDKDKASGLWFYECPKNSDNWEPRETIPWLFKGRDKLESFCSIER